MARTAIFWLRAYRKSFTSILQEVYVQRHQICQNFNCKTYQWCWKNCWGSTIILVQNQDVYTSYEHSKTDIANATWEFSKVMDHVNQDAFLEMHQVIRCVLNNKSIGSKSEPKGGKKESWGITYFSNNDNAGDLVTRRRGNSFVLYALGVPICLWSKAQTRMTLPSSEAELVTIRGCNENHDYSQLTVMSEKIS